MAEIRRPLGLGGGSGARRLRGGASGDAAFFGAAVLVAALVDRPAGEGVDAVAVRGIVERLAFSNEFSNQWQSDAFDLK